MTNTDFALEMFNNNIENAVKSLIEYINKPNNDVCMEISERRQITDEDARMIIKNLCKINNYFTTILQTDLILELFSKNRDIAKKEFIKYMNEPNKDEFIDIIEKEESIEVF